MSLVLAETPYWSVTEEEDGCRHVRMLELNKLVLSPPQRKYLTANTGQEVYVAGRGAAKSHCSLIKKLKRAYRNYAQRRAMGRDWIRAGPLYHLAVCAPSAPNYAANFKKLLDFIPKIDGTGRGKKPLYVWSARDKAFKLFGENQLQITLVTLWNPDNVRGEGWDDCLVDEAQDCDPDELEAVVYPMVFRAGFGDGIGDEQMKCITLAGSPKNNWLDEAAEQARDKRGFYGDWAYFSGTCYDNPLATKADRKAWARIQEKNPARFDREYLGKLKVRVSAEDAGECIFTAGLLACAYEALRFELHGPPLIVFDLAYGGKDRIVRGIWDRATCALVKLDIWTSEELKIETDNPWVSIKKLFERTAREYPGCKIVYDATGPYGSVGAGHIPRHVNAVGVVRNNAEKNKHVENFMERLAAIDPDGRSSGIQLPDPKKYPFENKKQRENVEYMIEEIVNYRMLIEESKKTGRKVVRYMKGEDYGDDTVDMVTIACSQLPAMRSAPRLNVKALNRYRFG